MEEPSGDKAEVGGMSAPLASLCLPRPDLREKALHGMKSSRFAGYWAAVPCHGERLGLSPARRSGH